MYTMKEMFLFINILLPVKTNLHCILTHIFRVLLKNNIYLVFSSVKYLKNS